MRKEVQEQKGDQGDAARAARVPTPSLRSVAEDSDQGLRPPIAPARKPTRDEMVSAFRAARVAADGKRNTPDTGTCNLDSAVWWPPRSMRSKKIEEAAEEAGVSVSITKWLGRAVFLSLGDGQASRNTAMCEAARDALTAAGFDAGVYYKMD